MKGSAEGAEILQSQQQRLQPGDRAHLAALVSSSGGATAHGYGGWPLDHTCTALSITLHVCSVLLRAAGADASVATSTRRVRSIDVVVVEARLAGGTPRVKTGGRRSAGMATQSS